MSLSKDMWKSHNNMMLEPLSTNDSEVYDIIQKEKYRQAHWLELIASENYPSRAVLETLGSCMNCKYSKGYPGERCYTGTENIDELEILCQKRALEAFSLDPEKWGVNVQSYSGSPANIAVYTAVVGPRGRIMGLDVPDGGHMSHGYKTSAAGVFFESMPYKVNPATGLVDYDKLEDHARMFHPKLIIAGASAYPRNLDYARFRQIADQHEAFLFSDICQIAGPVAAGVMPSPFDYSDIISTTVQKTLRGCRLGLIYYRKGVRSVNANGKETLYDLESPINVAVFPGQQGGPHNQSIAGATVALKQARTPEFKAYQLQVLANSKALANALISYGYKIITGGTDNHQMLLNLQPNGVNARWAEKVLEACAITCNSSSFPVDKTVPRPIGLRFGAPSLTTRGLVESDFRKVAEFIHRAIKLTLQIQSSLNPETTPQDLKKALAHGEKHQVAGLRADVEAFAGSFPLPGLPEIV